MKRIILKRPKESFNKYCSYEVFMGTQKLVELNNGEEKVIEIPENTNLEFLKAKIKWCGSEKLKISSITNNQKIIVSGNPTLNRYLPLTGSMFPIIGLSTINYTNSLVIKNIGIGILILLLVGIVGVLTIGKNKWIQFKKI